MHQNHAVYQKAIKLLEDFFNTEGEDADLMNVITNNGGLPLQNHNVFEF
jgi:hypothetical protein